MSFCTLKKSQKRSSICILLCLVFCFLFIANTEPAFAKDSVVKTSLFGNLKDDGKGCGVFLILNDIVDFLTYGIAIAAAIGIAVFGINYLTAAGDEAKAAKARRRMFEIVIGLAVYAVMWSVLSFLLPGGKLNTSSTCEKVSSSSTSSSSS